MSSRTAYALESAWLDAAARHNVEDLHAARSLVGKSHLRGPEKSKDLQTRRIPSNPPTLRAARIEPDPASPGDVRVVFVQGEVEDSLTMTRASLGELNGETGYLPVLADVWRNLTGSPPGGPSGPTTVSGAVVSRLGQIRQHAVGTVTRPASPPATPANPTPTPHQLRVDPASAILCAGCSAYFTPEFFLSFTGPDTVRVDGMTLCPCCSGPQEPTIVRGREDEAPESGVYLIVERDDE
jgi:hypothetical protein